MITSGISTSKQSVKRFDKDMTERIQYEIDNSHIGLTMHLSHARLSFFPNQILLSHSIQKLRRLDLSYNNISTIPKEIGQLSNLRELWLQHNPVQIIPHSIQDCTLLEVIDISHTEITDLPYEIAALQKLHELDWRETPMSDRLQEKHNIALCDLEGFMIVYNYFLTRENLKTELTDKLIGEIYVQEVANPLAKGILKEVVEGIAETFPDIEEFKLFVRRADKMLPEKLQPISNEELQKIKEKFYQMNCETRRQRLSAEVEIKLRTIYFDRISPATVTKILPDIYQHVVSLEDIQFLVKYASQLFPTNCQDVTGAGIWNAILDLQQQLTTKRDNAINALVLGMCQLYPEVNVDMVRQQAIEIAKMFQKERFATKREMTVMNRLCAEISLIFPVDFDSVTPPTIFNQAQAVFKRKA